MPKGKNGGKGGGDSSALLLLDPDSIYFTHARIRPIFTGCHKAIHETYEEIVSGKTTVDDIPKITVVYNQGSYFSLNNRRLYLFKQLRHAGLLPGNQVLVTVKQPLPREQERYLTSRCSLTARLMGRPEGRVKGSDSESDSEVHCSARSVTDEHLEISR